MAVSVSIDTLNAVTDKHFVRKLTDNFFLSSPLLYKLKDVEVPFDGGDDIRIPISHSDSTAAKRWGGRADTYDTELQDHATQAVFDIRFYSSSIAVPRTDILKNMGRARIVDLLKAQTQLAEDSLKDLMGIDLFLTGDSSEDSNTTNAKAGLTGLGAVITHGANPTSGAYGGITRVGASGTKNAPVGNAFWNANVLTANNAAKDLWKGNTTIGTADTILSLLKMQTMFGACTNGSEKPNLIVTSQILYDKYWSLLTAIQRQQTSEPMGKAGFDNLVFNVNTPVVVDDNIDNTGKMYFLDTKCFEWKPHRLMNFTPTPFKEAANQSVPTKAILFMGNLVCYRPNRQGVITGLTTS